MYNWLNFTENIHLDNADNALQNYLDNDSYRDKIMIGYYTYIFRIFVIPKLLYVLTYLYVLCSIQ